jgi:hypothetical protein
MSVTSLWTDELYSIVNFSAQGPITTVTDYRVPNNHVLFNLLNALTPGRGSLDPLRARLYSMLAVSALLALCVARFWWAGDFLSGALLFQLFAANRDFLDLTLQARGYGLAALLALLMALLTLRSLEGPGRGALLSLAVLTVLGGWTLPTFALFAVPLMATLTLATRRRDALIAAGVATLGLLGVYAPVWRPLLRHAVAYGGEWGREYASIGAVAVTLKTYLLTEPALGVRFSDVGVFGFGLAVAGAAVGLRARGDAEAKGARVVLLAVAAFFLLCLGIQTPLIRSTAFVAVPLAVAVVLLWRAGPRRWFGPIPRAALAVVAAVHVLPLNVSAAGAFTFVPREDWKGLGQAIEDTFPPGMPLVVLGEPRFLRGYLDRRHAIVDRSDPALARGEQALVDGIVEPREGQPGLPARPGGGIVFRLPQRRAGPVLWFSPPPRCLLETVVTPDGRDLHSRLCDRDLAIGSTRETGAPGQFHPPLRIRLDPGRRYRALIFVGDKDAGQRLRVQLRDPSGAPARPVGPIRASGKVTLVSLGDQRASVIELEWLPGADAGALTLREAWVYALD